jgi:hypothetical protein
MLLRLGILASVVVLTLASALNNWSHMVKYGGEIATLVIAAELLKPLLPVALAQHSANGGAGATARFVGTLTLWLIIVLFSAVNTFSNALTKQGARANQQHELAASVTRPEHLIRRDISTIPACRDVVKADQVLKTDKKGGGKIVTVRTTVADTACEVERSAKIQALESELATRKEREKAQENFATDKDAVPDGLIHLASLVGWRIQRHEVSIYTVLLWTLLAELGSALGGLCVPVASDKRKTVA